MVGMVPRYAQAIFRHVQSWFQHPSGWQGNFGRMLAGCKYLEYLNLEAEKQREILSQR